MLIPYQWLKQYVDFDLSPEELGAALTARGLEVEEIVAAPEGGDDLVLKAEITPNRGDCLSLLGVAREVASLVGTKVKYPPLEVLEDGGDIHEYVTVEIQDPDLGPRYSARLVRGVTVRPSPEWMQARLIAAGMRPINNLVDVTNYVMLEMGQPLHAFDYELLRGGKIIVRRARAGEVLTTIDGVDRPLQPHHLVIADAAGPVAVAGVMGGMGSEVRWHTKTVLLESAHFQPASIRRTARELGFDTPSEAAYRFARRVDPGGTIAALDRSAQLIAELAGGEIVAGVVDVYPARPDPTVITLRPERCNLVLGTDLRAEEIAAMLRSLELPVEPQDGRLVVKVPSFRGDLGREADLIEEVARVYGYDRIEATLPQTETAQGGLTRAQKLERRAREIMLAGGLDEIRTFSLTNPAALARANVPPEEIAQAVTMKNARSEEYSRLRPAMLPSVLEVVARNAAQRAENIRIFEIGTIYRALRTEMKNEAAEAVSRVRTGQTATVLPQPAAETRMLAGALVGTNWSATWNLDAPSIQADFYQLKGLIEGLLREFGIPEYTVERAVHPAFHPGRCARLVIDGEACGVFGEISAEVAQRYDVEARIYAFELNLDYLLALADLTRQFAPLPRYPAAPRDLAVVVREEVPSAHLEAVIRRESGHLLEDLCVFDVYKGPGIPEGHRSIAYSLTFRSPDRTLTDEEVETTMRRIGGALEQRFGARIRTESGG